MRLKLPQKLSGVFNLRRFIQDESQPAGGLKVEDLFNADPDPDGFFGADEIDREVDDKDELSLDVQPTNWESDDEYDDEGRRKRAKVEKEICQYVTQRFQEMSNSRRSQELEWALSLAFKEGRQWLSINQQASRIVPAQRKGEHLYYQTSNQMGPLIGNTVGMVTQASPDAMAVPMSEDRKEDGEAAEEANAIIADCNRRFNRETQTKERAMWSMVCGTSFLKVWWDKNAEQTVPKYDPTGMQVIGFHCQPVGWVKESVLPPFEVYLDQTAKRWEDVRDLMHVTIKPLSWYVDSFGEKGKKVTADAQSGSASYVDAYVDGGDYPDYGGTNWSAGRADSRKNCAVCYELWEKPSARWPKGRFIICTGDVLLHAGPWPYKKRDDFPFIPMRWGEKSGSPYGFCLGFELVPLQFSYNRILSKLVNQIESQKDYVTIQRLSNVGADAYNNTDGIDDDQRQVRKVYYNQGSQPPVVSRSPGASPELFNTLDMLMAQMQNIAGMHDISLGMAAARTPAEAVKLLQKADNTRHAFIRADIEQSIAAIHDWEVSLVAEFAPLPVVGMRAGTPGGAPLSEAGEVEEPEENSGVGLMSFDALQEGGQYRVIYVPGSTLKDSPDDKLVKYTGLFQMGVFGDPTDPDVASFFTRLVDMPEGRAITQHLERMAQKQQAMAAAQAEAMAAQGAQEAAGPAPGPSIEEQMALAQHQEELRAQSQSALTDQKHQNDLEKMQVQAGIDVGKMEAQGQMGVKQKAAEGLIQSHTAALTNKLVPPPPIVKSGASGGAKKKPATKKP